MQKNYWITRWVNRDNTNEAYGVEHVENANIVGSTTDVVAGFDEFVKRGRLNDLCILMTYTTPEVEQQLRAVGLIELDRAIERLQEHKGKFPKKWEYLVDQVQETFKDLL